MSIIKITDLKLSDKIVLIRSDLNVPITDNKIKSDARIQASLPTIKYALKHKAKVIVMSHLGRPIEGTYDSKLSLLPVFEYLKKTLINNSIYFSNEYTNKINIQSGELLLLENVRFNIGEKNNSKKLSKQYANICDIFVMDAFGTAHRKEASTYGIINYANIACSGLLLESELKTLKIALKNPPRPMVAIIGGAKVSTKFNVLTKLAQIADTVIVGGGIANTFIAIDNYVGRSLHESKFVSQAKYLRDHFNIFIPTDSKVSTTFNKNSIAINKKVSDIHNDEEIMDFGDDSIKSMVKIINNSKTILWNGPIGVFEFKNFRKGTEILAYTIANSNSFSIAGGGDTLSVIDMFKIKNKLSYISTGGGSFLEYLEKKELPVIQLLKKQSFKC